MNFPFRSKKSKARSAASSDDGYGSHSPSASLNLDEGIESIMPSSWDLSEKHQNTNLQISHDHQDETTVSIHNTSSMSRVTVVANTPIPAAQLKKLAGSRYSRGDVAAMPSLNHHASMPIHPQATRSAAPDLSNLFPAPSTSSRTTSGPAGLYPAVLPSARNINALDRPQEESLIGKLNKDSLYYFEVTIQSLPAGCDAGVGVVLDKVGSSIGEFIPGETRDSIGLDSNGILRANGKVIGPETLPLEGFSGRIEGFGEGDVVGCAVEVSGQRRVFFTKNGRIIVPPNRFSDIEMKKILLCPSFGVKVNRNQTVQAVGNFGADPRRPFIWGQSAYLAYMPLNGSSTPSNNQQHRTQSRTPPPPFRSRQKQKKPINRQLSAPAGGPDQELTSPPNIRQIRGQNTARQNADRQTTSLSPAANLYQRATRPGRKGNAPLIAIARRESDDNSNGGHHSLGSQGSHSQGDLIDDTRTELGASHESPMDGHGDELMSASTSRLDSEWQTPNGNHDESSGFLSTTPGTRPSLEFSAISETENEQDPFVAPESRRTSGGTNHPREEEKNAIESIPEHVASNAPAGTLTPGEIEGMRENARTLRSVCADDAEVDESFLESLLDFCRADKQTVAVSLDNAFLSEGGGVPMALFELNDLILEAVTLGEKAVTEMKNRAVAEPPPTQKQNSNLDLDINGLIRKKDVFSLICILRAQSDQRLDAALALMEFAQDGERPEEGGSSLRDEIRSSGGMHSLLQVFRAKGTAYELRVVSGMAVAYVLPSLMKCSPGVGLKIMECLRFLSVSRTVSPNGVRIPQETMFKASAMGVFSFWMNVLEPLLASGPSVEETTTERSNLHMISNSAAGFAAAGGIFDQGHETLELQELLEMAVSLIIHIQKHCDAEAANGNCSDDQVGDDLSMWRYTNVEQVCTVDVARPIAVREGLLPILIEWIKSNDKDKVRPAVSALRYLTSIKDKYMAGWIHSQMVNEGALAEVIKLAENYNAGHDVRLAVAQILASLCVAPHTRAAVVEARCINYLIGFLYDHSDPASEEVALFAGHAITQLAAGAITRASVFGGGDTEILDFVSPDKRDSLVDDIVNGGAVGSFIAIALENDGQLRAMAIEAVRVLSEDRSPDRRTRLQFVEDGAAKALGRALQSDVNRLSEALRATSHENRHMGQHDLFFSVLEKVFLEVHDALCGLANLLEPIEERKNSNTDIISSTLTSPQVVLAQGCMQTADCGGLISLLRISTMSLAFPKMKEDPDTTTRAGILLREACRSLSSLSPLLLTGKAAQDGYARWAASILDAFNKILAAAVAGGVEELDQRQELFSVLCGLDALSTSEPLKIRIVDRTLSSVVQLKNFQGEQSDVANVAGQVFYSLGFAEDEIAVQVAGSNPNLLADWFCLRRSLIIQAMVRAEMRKKLASIWCRAYAAVEKDDSERHLPSYERGMEAPIDALSELDFFDNFADDDDTYYERETMVRQYRDVYASTGAGANVPDLDYEFDTAESVNLLAKQVYPFNDERTEIDWILSHERSIYGNEEQEDVIDISLSLPQHLETSLDCCLPSKLLRNHVLPVFCFRPDASFNYRAIMMPQRQYFSFRREGQMVSRLCDIQPEALQYDEVHWSLGFTNSSFAGEFSESLVQALYLCPTIRGLSFARDAGFQPDDTVEDIDGESGSALLAKLVGSLPPWIDYLTMKNIFSDRELRTLIANVETMGKLSADQDGSGDEGNLPRGKGRFWSLAITHSPQISETVWQTFFSLLGRTPQLPNRLSLAPLSNLMSLDLSFNELGDTACARILEIAHDSSSGCNLEQLDLAGNRIGKGSQVVKMLRTYVDTHRFVPILDRKGWGSRLHTLNLASNNLGVGQAGIEILSFLKYNAFGLKVLDLSDNDIYHGDDDYNFSHLLASSLRKNTILCQLNLAGNRLSSHIIDDIMERLLNRAGSSRLCFFGIERNSPPLTVTQISCMEAFLLRTRAAVLHKNMTDMAMLIEEEEDADEDWVDELKVDHDEPQPEKKIIRKNVSIRTLPTDESNGHGGGPRGDNMITVLFSAPLVFTDDQRQLRPFKKLDFDMERELMWQCMKEASRDIELSFDNATHDRLLAAMTKRCSCLHYSGHGHQMYLPFEDGSGGPNWFKVDDIRSLIAREGAAPFKFVFVSACHSGLAGETFASAGVPHVVCCQQEFELKDTAALAFTRQFYLSLAVGHTVKESFEQGCRAVRATPNLHDAESEMKKFLLLPKDGNHNVPIFNAASVSEWPKLKGTPNSRRSYRKSKPRTRSMFGAGTKQSELGVRNMMQEDPSPTPPQFFLGREVDMYFVLKSILSKRLVSVVGEQGVGRSSTVCAVCHYINERASTILAIEKIYFVKARQGRRGDSCRSLLEQLQRKLVESEAGKGETPERGADMEDVFEFICNSLKNEKALVVFDRMELLENSDDEMKDFLMFLTSLFRGTKHVKVLLTGRKQLGRPSLGGQVETPIPLGPLNYENTVRLFANLCPHLHTEGERYKLYKRLVNDYRQAHLKPLDEGVDERTRGIFSALGDGIPSRIEKAAYDVTSERLQDLVDIP